MLAIIILFINQTWASPAPRTPINDKEIIFPVRSTPRKTGFKDYDTLRDELLDKFIYEEIDEQMANLNETILNNLIEKLKNPNTTTNTDLDEELLKHFKPSEA